MGRPPLHAPILVNFTSRKLPAHVTRHTTDGGYIVALDKKGGQLFSSSFQLVGIRISYLHPNVGDAARIRPPSSKQWISCFVKELIEPAPTVLLEACNTDILPAPLFDTKTFAEFKIALEYVDNESKHNDAKALMNIPPAIGTELEIRILGAWRTGKIVELQSEPHYVVEVPGVGRLFSQSFRLLQYETRVKRLQLGTRAIVHLKSRNISCVVVEHLQNSSGFILAACSDEELLFDSRALLVLGIEMTVTVTVNKTDEMKSVSPKSPKKEYSIEKPRNPSPSSSLKKRHVEMQVPEDFADPVQTYSNTMNVQVFSQNEGISSAPRKRRKKQIIEEEDEEGGISPQNVRAAKTNQSQNEYSFRAGSEDVPNANVMLKENANHSAMGDSRGEMREEPDDVPNDMVDGCDDEMQALNNPAPQNRVDELPKAKAIAELVCEDNIVSEEDAKLKRIRERIVKAFRRGLHHGTPEAEMKRAMALGRSLVKQYNLDEAKLIAESKRTERVDESGRVKVLVVKNDETHSKRYLHSKRYPHQPWMHILAYAVSKNYSVDNIYDTHRHKPTCFTFFGLRPNAELAAHSFCTAFEQVHRLALNYRYNPKKHRRQKVKDVRLSYALGMAQSLEEIAIYTAERELKSTSCRALIVRTEKAIESELDNLGLSNFDFDKPVTYNVVRKAHKDGCKDSSKVRL